MAQRARNLTAVACVAAEAWVQSLTWGSGLKDLARWHLRCRLQLRQQLPCPTSVVVKKKKKIQKREVWMDEKDKNVLYKQLHRTFVNRLMSSYSTHLRRVLQYYKANIVRS